MQLASTKPKAQCEDITIIAGDGRVFNLGQPTSMLFKLRVFIYKLRRWKEL